MLTHLRPALVTLALFTLLTGLAYPLALTGLAQLALKAPADGSLVRRGDAVVGSALIGQNFTSDRYFQGRPSATSAPDPKDATKTVDAPYNAASSNASNLGPTSQKLVDRVKAAVAALGGSPGKPVPADAVTTSASGLDPDISAAYAALQVPRVAAARKLDPARLQALVADHTSPPGLAGLPHINVLNLNIDLDTLNPASGGTTPQTDKQAEGTAK